MVNGDDGAPGKRLQLRYVHPAKLVALNAKTYRDVRAQAFATWRQETCARSAA
jgi:hypothetical protein